MILRWPTLSTTFVLYTEVELRLILRSFGHPSVPLMNNILKRAEKDGIIDNSTRKAIEAIRQTCDRCRENQPRQGTLG